MKRDLRALLQHARQRGWRVERTRSGHWRLQHRTGALVFTGTTPSCPRSLRNLRADLKRAERRDPRQ
jgi:hypothetical protein